MCIVEFIFWCIWIVVRDSDLGRFCCFMLLVFFCRWWVWLDEWFLSFFERLDIVISLEEGDVYILYIIGICLVCDVSIMDDGIILLREIILLFWLVVMGNIIVLIDCKLFFCELDDWSTLCLCVWLDFWFICNVMVFDVVVGLIVFIWIVCVWGWIRWICIGWERICVWKKILIIREIKV